MNALIRGRSTLLLLAVLLLAAGLRFYRIEAQSFWHDEGNAVGLARRDVARILAGAGGDIHPPGYYLLLAGWTRVLGERGELPYRSLSAVAGVALVAVVYGLGARLFGPRAGLFAALLTAASPFQIYYGQEARMYALLALAAGLSMLALLRWIEGLARGELDWAAGALVAGANAAGLYIHYVYPVVIAVQNLAFLAWWLARRRAAPAAPAPAAPAPAAPAPAAPAPAAPAPAAGEPLSSEPLSSEPLSSGALWRGLLAWAGLQALALALYLPWLPIAVRQVTTWPAGPGRRDPGALLEMFRLLVFGPTIATEAVTLGLICAAFFAALAFWRLARPGSLALLLAWLGLPVALLFALGWYRDETAKFLIVAAAPLALLAGRGLDNLPRLVQHARALPGARWSALLWAGLGAFLLAMFVDQNVRALDSLYHDPAYARADYRGIAARIASLARPDDAILFLAPNQWEVFTIYFPDDGRLYPLARQRPLDVAAQARELEAIVARHPRLFALYWAAEQADPEHFVERWLAGRTVKADDQWYGDVRLAVYAVPPEPITAREHVLDAQFGEAIALRGYTLRGSPARPGDILTLALFWEALAPPGARYKVFVHLIGPDGALAGQHDAEPGDTSAWTAGQAVVDTHGVIVPLDAAPGAYELRAGLYPADGGPRLPVTVDGRPSGDTLVLATIDVR
jgi:hypothetical protein